MFSNIPSFQTTLELAGFERREDKSCGWKVVAVLTMAATVRVLNTPFLLSLYHLMPS